MVFDIAGQKILLGHTRHPTQFHVYMKRKKCIKKNLQTIFCQNTVLIWTFRKMPLNFHVYQITTAFYSPLYINTFITRLRDKKCHTYLTWTITKSYIMYNNELSKYSWSDLLDLYIVTLQVRWQTYMTCPMYRPMFLISVQHLSMFMAKIIACRLCILLDYLVV